MKHLLTLLTALLLVSCAKDRIRLTSYGLTDNETVKTITADQTIAGEIDEINGWNLVETTDQIPNKIGSEFGISYMVRGNDPNQPITVEEVIIFPGDGLTNPESGLTSKSDTEPVEAYPGWENYFCYTLDYPWEAKSGNWVFQVKIDGKVELEKTFHVK